MVPYDFAIVVSAIILAAIASSRFAYILGKRWDWRGDGPGIFSFVAAIASGIVMYFIITAVLMGGGILMGVVALFLTIPAVGFAWIFVVGGNQALERILNGLLKKLS